MPILTKIWSAIYHLATLELKFSAHAGRTELESGNLQEFSDGLYKIGVTDSCELCAYVCKDLIYCCQCMHMYETKS